MSQFSQDIQIHGELNEREKILNFVKEITYSILSLLIDGKEPFMFVQVNLNPSKSTQIYQPFKLTFSNEVNASKLALYVKTLSIIQKLIENNQFASKRDIYYQFKHLYGTQLMLDKILNDLSRTLRVSRTSFHILASAKGLIAGDLQLTLSNGQIINYTDSLFGSLVPNQIDSIVQMSTHRARFVLIVEKDATFQRLMDDNFVQKYPAILITAKGMPDISTRQLVNLMGRTLKDLKFFCLTDANPYGIQIMLTYKYGSKVFEHDMSNLNMLGIEWVGLKLTDLDVFNLEKRGCLLKLSSSDIRLAKSMTKKLQLLHEFDLIEQIEYMLKYNCKAELQYLQNISNSFLCNTYLRAKLNKYI